MKRTVVCLCVWLLPWGAGAHGPLHQQIAAVSREVERRPTDARLYLKRSDLYRRHGNWQAALADCDRAARLNPEMATVGLYRGQVLLDAGRWEEAKATLDAFLADVPNDVDGLVARARVLVKLGRHRAAADDFTRALAAMTDPKPEPYLERAQALAAMGDRFIDEAIRGLDEGLEKLGASVPLQWFAIDLEVRRRRFDEALARLERLMERSPRKELWLTRRGDILARAGRIHEARVAFMEALIAIESLPQAHRRSKAIEALRERLRVSLEHLNHLEEGK